MRSKHLLLASAALSVVTCCSVVVTIATRASWPDAGLGLLSTYLLLALGVVAELCLLLAVYLLLRQIARLTRLTNEVRALLKEDAGVHQRDLSETERVVAAARDRLLFDRSLVERRAAAMERILFELPRDTREPLGVLSDLLERLSMGSSFVESTTRAAAEIFYLGQLIENQCLQARLEQGVFSPAPQYVDLRDVLKRALTQFERMTKRPGFHVSVLAPQLPVWIWADASLVDRAVANLVHSALSEATMRASVSLQVSEGRFVLIVSSNVDTSAGSSDRVARRWRGSALELSAARLALEATHCNLVLSRDGDGHFEARVEGNFAAPQGSHTPESTPTKGGGPRR